MALKSIIVLKSLKVLAWVVFLGLCVKAGSIFYSYFASMYFNELGAKNLHSGLDLSQLKTYSNTNYSILVLCIATIIATQAYLFYVVIQIFKKINLVSPFHKTVGDLIKKMSFYSLVIGIVSKLTVLFSERYIKEGMNFPHLTEYIGLGDAFLFFAGILYFISVLFAKGIEIQSENDLTV
jgi:Protein of unknown function (DUF2975)